MTYLHHKTHQNGQILPMLPKARFRSGFTECIITEDKKTSSSEGLTAGCYFSSTFSSQSPKLHTVFVKFFYCFNFFCEFSERSELCISMASLKAAKKSTQLQIALHDDELMIEYGAQCSEAVQLLEITVRQNAAVCNIAQDFGKIGTVQPHTKHAHERLLFKGEA